MSIESMGTVISELRKAKGATQEDLAKHAGVSPQAVSKWECGGMPDIELLPAIADFLEVSIDKLFGRTINDYSDIKTEIIKYLAPQDGKSSLGEAFNLTWAIQQGIGGSEKYHELELKESRLNSHINQSSGFTMMSVYEALQYFFILPKPGDGWLKVLPQMAEYAELFKMLGDIDVLNALVLLNTRENKPFTPNLLVKELSVTIDKAESILNNLKTYKFLDISEIELDDETKEVHTFSANPAFIALLIFAAELIQRPNAFSWYMGYTNNGYFKN